MIGKYLFLEGGELMANNHSIAQRKYDDKNCRRVNLKLNLKTDEDILKKLANVDSIQGYIKQLIRKDLKQK